MDLRRLQLVDGPKEAGECGLKTGVHAFCMHFDLRRLQLVDGPKEAAAPSTTPVDAFHEHLRGFL